MALINISKAIKTLNPVVGCTFNCNYCYARKVNTRFHITEDFSQPCFFEERLKQLHSKKPSTFLLTSMSDFADWKPEWIQITFEALKQNPQHEYLLLTKRPEALDTSITLPHVWMGVTITSKNERERIRILQEKVKASQYFITLEPLQSDVETIDLSGVSWVVIGSETGNRKGKIKTDPAWVKNIVLQAKKNAVPVFMKEKLVDVVGEQAILQELPQRFHV